jgi:hypothetical protein
MPAHDPARHAARQRLSEEACRAQRAALRRLYNAGFSEAELEIAMEYFTALLKRLLTEADALYGVYETLRLSHPGRSAANQQWLDTQFARLLYVYQESMTAAMRQATHNLLHAAYPRQDMFGEPSLPPRPPTWPGVLWRGAKIFIWLMGLFAGSIWLLAVNDALFGGFVPASYLLVGAGLVLLCGAWRTCGLSRWGLLLPVSLVSLVLWAVTTAG